MLHTMLRIGDIKRSFDFYTNCLGMKLLRTKDVPEDEFTLVFLRYGDESNTTVLELTCNYASRVTIWRRFTVTLPLASRMSGEGGVRASAGD